MLVDELRWVKRRPTHWRWALVALYNGVGHTLAAHRPTTFLPYTGIGQLSKLFEAVAAEHPEIADGREAVEEIDRLRTVWITKAVERWPAGSELLPRRFLDCLQITKWLRVDSNYIQVAAALLTARMAGARHSP